MAKIEESSTYARSFGLLSSPGQPMLSEMLGFAMPSRGMATIHH